MVLNHHQSCLLTYGWYNKSSLLASSFSPLSESDFFLIIIFHVTHLL